MNLNRNWEEENDRVHFNMLVPHEPRNLPYLSPAEIKGIRPKRVTIIEYGYFFFFRIVFELQYKYVLSPERYLHSRNGI